MQQPDLINRPPHYIGAGLEVIDIIEDWGLGFHLGNALKYTLRAGRKGDRWQDLEKALWYVTRASWLPAHEMLAVSAVHAISTPRITQAFKISDHLALAVDSIERATLARDMGDARPLLMRARMHLLSELGLNVERR